MAGRKGDLSIPWPFENMKIRLNTDTGFLKLIAMACMLVDHLGAALFPTQQVMRIIGRMAYPLYAYCLVVGCVHTRDILRYFKRIVLLALITQPIYVVAMSHTNADMFSVSFAQNPVGAICRFYINSWQHPSVLLTLLFALVLIWAIRDRHIVLALAALIAAWFARGIIDFGFFGVLLVLVFFLLAKSPWLAFPLSLAFIVWWAMQGTGYTLFGVTFSWQIFAAFALPFICLRTNTHIRLPKWLFYAFYPLHFALIQVLKIL